MNIFLKKLKYNLIFYQIKHDLNWVSWAIVRYADIIIWLFLRTLSKLLLFYSLRKWFTEVFNKSFLDKNALLFYFFLKHITIYAFYPIGLIMQSTNIIKHIFKLGFSLFCSEDYLYWRFRLLTRYYFLLANFTRRWLGYQS